jgi:hypothetical protein
MCNRGPFVTKTFITFSTATFVLYGDVLVRAPYLPESVVDQQQDSCRCVIYLFQFLHNAIEKKLHTNTICGRILAVRCKIADCTITISKKKLNKRWSGIFIFLGNPCFIIELCRCATKTVPEKSVLLQDILAVRCPTHSGLPNHLITLFFGVSP